MKCFGERVVMARVLLGVVAISLGTGTTSFAQRGKRKSGAERALEAIKQNSVFHRNLEYARVGNRSLKLNLLVPKNSSKPTPLVIWFHGGGWEKGSKDGPTPAAGLLLVGYAVASVEYRFLDDAPFPAQIHDCKAAVRWLRANAGKYNLDADKFAAWGHSAGGHLASLLGTSGDVEEFEGRVGRNLGVSSRVQAVCNYCGPVDFEFGMEDAKRNPIPKEPAASLRKLLVEGAERDVQANAKAFSPISYVSRDDAPVLMVVGSEDPIMSETHARRFTNRLRDSGVKNDLIVLRGVGHAGKAFGNPQLLRQVAAFFDAAW